MKLLRWVLALLICTNLQAHNTSTNTDTLNHKEYLPEITVVGNDSRKTTYQLPEIVGTHIYAGKKNALVVVNNVNGNIVNNTMRQILAKVPGIHIWESDGSGIQIGIATRGLSANRSWDFNVRQNGIDISADPFGYPEAYYNPPMMAVQRLQIVKGAASLQYGPQLGGMLNYVLKNGHDVYKPFQFETQQTIGSFGLVNTFNAIGGKINNNHYYAFYDHKNATGWRNNSTYKTNTAFATFTHQFNTKIKSSIEFLHYSMLQQQPGGLTDSLFSINAQQSFRKRNWLNINWMIVSNNTDYKINENNIINFKTFYLYGNRSSVGYINNINIKDTINHFTKEYNYRTIDIDQYKNSGAELRYLTNYSILNIKNTATIAVKYFCGNTIRLKNGKGNTESNYTVHNLNNIFNGDMQFATNNFAVAIENAVKVKKLLIIPAIRYEYVSTKANGRISFNNNGTENKMNDEYRKRQFFLLGLATEYHTKNGEVYANITQSYRPVQFADLAVSATTDIIDANLKDAKAISIDLGYRAKIKNYANVDANIFYLDYNNRIGTIVQQTANSTSTYNFKTNLGKSISKGLELLLEFNLTNAKLITNKIGEFNVFTSYSYTNAAYQNFKVVTKNNNNVLAETNLKGNKVENAPEHILRAGINYFYKAFSLTTQLSYVSQAFADAGNTNTPNSAATIGLIPSYTIVDAAATYHYQQYTFKTGVNNIFNKMYFTRRAGGFPGPGLMPADKTNFFITLAVKL